MAVAAPAGSLSSTWYCAAGTAVRGARPTRWWWSPTPGLAHSQPRSRWSPSPAVRGTRQVVAPPHSRVRVLLRSILTAPFVAALVEVRGGGVSVDREVTGPNGYDAGPCASSSSDHWYFAAGNTLRGANEYLALFNPYPDDASVDMTFVTEQGPTGAAPVAGVSGPGSFLAGRASQLGTGQPAFAPRRSGRGPVGPARGRSVAGVRRHG